MSTTVVWNPVCREHYAGAGHPERPQRIAAVLDALRAAELAAQVRWLEAPPAGRAALERVHPPAYLDHLETIARDGGGMAALDPDTIMGPRTWARALAAAGGALAAVERGIADGTAFAATRPPGPHAPAGPAVGFCFPNNLLIPAPPPPAPRPA